MQDSNEYQVCEDVFAPCNDFSFIDTRLSEQKQTLEEYEGIVEVSIVIPHYNQKSALNRTLSALSKQTIPPKNIQIVVCDDGSDQDLEDVILSWQDTFESLLFMAEPKKGFRLARMRNLGLKATKNRNIILLDCDMMPKKDLVEKHIRVLNTCDYVISIGYRHHTNVDLLTNEEINNLLEKKVFEFSELDWRLNTCSNEQDLISRMKWDSYFAWSCTSGGNLGFTSKVLEDDILFDENFKFWGGEDNEWAYRLFKKGFYFYPNFGAIAIHQDAENPNRVDRGSCMSYLTKRCPRIADAYKNMEYTQDDIPLISFWMCNNNRSSYIKQAIESLMPCPYRFEIVVVDDESKDESVTIVQELMQKYHQIRLIQKEKGPLGEGFKKALDSCRGELLIQIDSDDFIQDMGALVELMITGLFSTYGLIYGHHFLVEEDGSFKQNGWVYPQCDRTKSLFEGMHIHPPRVIHIRDYSRARAIDTTLETAVDYDLYSKILEVTNGVFINKDIYAYRQHPNSVSANKEDSQKQNIAKIIEERLLFYDVLGKFSFDPTIPRACRVTRNGHPKLLIQNRFTKKG